jgi:hypothetical protein
MGDTLWGTVTDGPVTIDARYYVTWKWYSVRATHGHFKVGDKVNGATLSEAIGKLRASAVPTLSNASNAAHVRAARVLRVLDGAKIGEGN